MTEKKLDLKEMDLDILHNMKNIAEDFLSLNKRFLESEIDSEEYYKKELYYHKKGVFKHELSLEKYKDTAEYREKLGKLNERMNNISESVLEFTLKVKENIDSIEEINNAIKSKQEKQNKEKDEMKKRKVFYSEVLILGFKDERLVEIESVETDMCLQRMVCEGGVNSEGFNKCDYQDCYVYMDKEGKFYIQVNDSEYNAVHTKYTKESGRSFLEMGIQIKDLKGEDEAIIKRRYGDDALENFKHKFFKCES